MKFNWIESTKSWKDNELHSLADKPKIEYKVGLNYVLVTDEITWRPKFIVIYPDGREYYYLSSRVEIEDYKNKHGKDLIDDLLKDHIKEYRKEKLKKLNEV